MEAGRRASSMQMCPVSCHLGGCTDGGAVMATAAPSSSSVLTLCRPVGLRFLPHLPTSCCRWSPDHRLISPCLCSGRINPPLFVSWCGKLPVRVPLHVLRLPSVSGGLLPASGLVCCADWQPVADYKPGVC